MKLSLQAQECLNKAKAVGWDLNLDTIKALLVQLDNPQNKIKTVHITGTNGKGSTAAFLTQMLIYAGYSVGRYTSPAVDDELERYTINNKWINEEDYNGLIEAISIAADIVTKQGFRYPSLFEIETTLSYLYFAMSKCDINIIEVGMGGLMDATNVIDNTMMCVFTSIGMDHQQWLGPTLTDITKNKAGIIKFGSLVVSAPQEADVESVLKDTAKANCSDIFFSKPINSTCKLSLPGSFQYINAGLACECAHLLNIKGYEISHDDIALALRNTKWPFRFETISNDPPIILDGAHNIPAILELKKTLLKLYPDKKFTFVVSVLKDKNFQDMFKEIIPLAHSVVTVQSNSYRALDADSLANCVSLYCNDVQNGQNPQEAAQKALDLKNDMIICFGTFTFLKDMREAFKELQF